MYVCMLGLIYCSIRARTFEPGVSGRNISLAASIWRILPWFILELACSHGVWVVVMDVIIFGFMLVRFG